MTLGRRLTLQLASLLLCLLVTAAVGVWGLMGLRQDYSLALDHYERLRQVYQVGFHLQSARLAMSSDFPDPPRARLEVRRALEMFTQQQALLSIDPALIDETVHALRDAADAFNTPHSTAALDLPVSRLNEVVNALRGQVKAAQASGDRRQQRTVWLMIGVAMLTVLASLVIGRRQFRAVMRPLTTFSAGVRRVAAGGFDPPLTMPEADDEFAALARDFNHMAAELRAMYEQLNQRIDAATRSLVQSERLAGIGLMAAGVAHEINNHLSIITGRLELLLAKPGAPEWERPLRVVLEEAFRCKRIIDRLLLLSRAPSTQRGPVRLDELAREAVAALAGLGTVGSRRFDLQTQPVVITADDAEVRQVLLNLLLNAVQFTTEQGRIAVRVGVLQGEGELLVQDDGRGIDPAELPRLFEPFYSTPRGEQRGTGLGLAISKAIVEAHGGTLQASSDGPGRGSRFVVRWPIGETLPG
ncbi:MAG: ATP-binding protein [Tepidisphaeraceae bacterium]